MRPFTFALRPRPTLAADPTAQKERKGKKKIPYNPCAAWRLSFTALEEKEEEEDGKKEG